MPIIASSSHPVRRTLAALLCCVAVAATACSSSKSSSVGSSAKTVNIVAGENFWGSIVSQLAGRAGRVTSIVTDPNADPHSYQSSSTNARAFADAGYVVLNGAGYDAWAEKLITGNPNAARKVFTVADLLGKKEGDNPHFWYNPDYVTKVADQVTADLKAIDPSDAAYFDAQRTAFNSALNTYFARLGAIKAKFSGTAVASTESIFVYLGDYLGLNIVSPTEFMNAVAEGNDPPAPSVVAFQDLLTKKQAKVLVYNKQTSTAVTTNLRTLATNHAIPVVGVTETLQPPGATFQDWFSAQLLDLQNALNAGTSAGA
jgi:zinc/manganese transport system substrate-binding protein